MHILHDRLPVDMHKPNALVNVYESIFQRRRPWKAGKRNDI
jgi:hypothetical protein